VEILKILEDVKLNFVLEKCGGMRIGFIWFRTGKSGRCLWI